MKQNNKPLGEASGVQDDEGELLSTLKHIKKQCNKRGEILAGIIYSIASNAIFDYETAKIKSKSPTRAALSSVDTDKTLNQKQCNTEKNQ